MPTRNRGREDFLSQSALVARWQARWQARCDGWHRSAPSRLVLKSAKALRSHSHGGTRILTLLDNYGTGTPINVVLHTVHATSSIADSLSVACAVVGFVHVCPTQAPSHKIRPDGYTRCCCAPDLVILRVRVMMAYEYNVHGAMQDLHCICACTVRVLS